MKKILYFLIIFAFVACDDDLELSPEQSLSTEGAFANELAARASLFGAYSRLQDLDVFGSMPQIIGDFQADNVDFIGSFPTLQDIKNNVVTADNGTIETIFRDHYRAILAANAVIKNAPNVDDTGFSDAEKAAVVAEAKFIRALTNFNLVNLFAQPYTLDNGASNGIVLVTEPNVLESNFVLGQRSTVAEVYTAIEQDLMDVLQDIGSGVNSRNRGSVGAANALLSRLYLYKGDNTNAALYAKNVIDDTNYELASDYSFFDQYTAETIFDVDQSAIDNGRTGSGGWAEFYNPAEAGARGDCPMDPAFIAAHDPADKRLTDLIQYSPDSSLAYTTKFPNVQTNEDNAPVLRVTEMYLNRAEALAKLATGIDEEALGLINELRERAGLDALEVADFADKDAFIDAILDERRKELAFEGHRRMDLLRNGKEIRNGLTAGDDRAIMPIPAREIDLESSLPQNPGY